MKGKTSRIEAKKQVDSFFDKPNIDSAGIRKMKHLSMSHRIKLGERRKLFCKKCLTPLRGKVRVSKNVKTVVCSTCSYQNQIRIS